MPGVSLRPAIRMMAPDATSISSIVWPDGNMRCPSWSHVSQSAASMGEGLVVTVVTAPVVVSSTLRLPGGLPLSSAGYAVEVLLLARSPVMLPIPGTSRPEHLDENWASRSIQLSADEIADIARAARSA